MTFRRFEDQWSITKETHDMTTIQPSRETVERTLAQIRDIFDLARKVHAAESDWGLYEIAATLLRTAGEIAPSYQVLSLTAGAARHIAARCGDAPGCESPSPEIAEAVRSVNWRVMTQTMGHRTAGLQKQLCALAADPRIPLPLIPKLAEQFCDNAAGGHIDRLEAIESGIHLIAYLASMGGDAIATLNAVERELLGPIEAEPRAADPPTQEQEKTE
jgi:hypothetical protein